MLLAIEIADTHEIGFCLGVALEISMAGVIITEASWEDWMGLG